MLKLTAPTYMPRKTLDILNYSDRPEQVTYTNYGKCGFPRLRQLWLSVAKASVCCQAYVQVQGT